MTRYISDIRTPQGYTPPQSLIHSTAICSCDQCRWASEVEARQSLQSRKDRIAEARRNLIAEIDRMQAEVNRLDEEFDRLEDEELR